MAGLGKIFGRGLAVAVAAAGLAVAAPAGATSYLKLISDSMNLQYEAYINAPGVYQGGAYSNGVTFNVLDVDQNGVSLGNPAREIFGFCVDIYHEINAPATLGYQYQSNQDLSVTDPLPYDFGGTTLPHQVGDDQLAAITKLVNTGYYLHANETDGNRSDTEMRLAAIQAAIWHIEVPSIGVSVIQNGNPGNLSDTDFTTYQQYFHDYTTPGGYTPLGDRNDRFYVISDGVHQSFAIGWPIDGVPEPATWGLMIVGFGGVGAALRRRRMSTAFA